MEIVYIYFQIYCLNTSLNIVDINGNTILYNTYAFLQVKSLYVKKASLTSLFYLYKFIVKKLHVQIRWLTWPDLAIVTVMGRLYLKRNYSHYISSCKLLVTSSIHITFSLWKQQIHTLFCMFYLGCWVLVFN